MKKTVKLNKEQLTKIILETIESHPTTILNRSADGETIDTSIQSIGVKAQEVWTSLKDDPDYGAFTSPKKWVQSRSYATSSGESKEKDLNWEKQAGYAASDFMAGVHNLFKQIEQDLLRGKYRK